MANSDMKLAGSTSANDVTVRNSDDGTLRILKDTTEIASLGAAAVKLGTDAIQVDASKNVGIGVVPDDFGVGKNLNVGYTGVGIFSSGSNQNYVLTNTKYSAGWKYAASSLAATMFVSEDGAFNWKTAPSGTAGNAITWTTAMTLDASGNLCQGVTSATDSVSFGSGKILDKTGPMYLRNVADPVGYYACLGPSGSYSYLEAKGSSTRMYVIANTNGVYLDSGATSWTSASDERLKTIIEPITNAVDKVSQLRTVIGRYNTDEETKRRSFVIAQDVLSVLPEAVVTTDPESLGVQYTDLIPLALAAIKELSTELTAVKAELAALKG